MKVIFDVNVWVSFAIGKRLSVLKDILKQSNIAVFCCDELLVEFIETSQKPSLQKYLLPERTTETIELIKNVTTWAEINRIIAISRDADDDYLLALSKRVRANYLVTGDKDLLVLKQHGRTQIVTFSTFLEIATPTQKS
jgi:uncharacterized protein